MSDVTPRFQLPFILPGQAQKELHHNEALIRLDMLAHAAVEQADLAVPPVNPEDGQCWIVASGASDAWAGREHALAMASGAGWRFISPQFGMQVWNKANSIWLHWTGSARSDELVGSRLVVAGQQIVTERQPAIATPYGGTIIDQEARAALAAVIATLMSHGLTE